MRRPVVVIVATVSLVCSIGVWAADKSTRQAPQAYGQEENLANGVIGVSLHVGADRVGDPAVLYVAMVHPQGPAQEAGLAHGDEITSVDGAAVSGKSYEELVKMIRGSAGTVVRLGVKGEAGTREVSVTRVPSETLAQGPGGSRHSPTP
ncbi:PDZ domain-containing protein [Nitrospira sp. Nam74]